MVKTSPETAVNWLKEGEDMAQLSDTIEQFIKELMSEDAHIELRRNELAQHFGCVPSQINYVLSTRFSVLSPCASSVFRRWAVTRTMLSMTSSGCLNA